MQFTSKEIVIKYCKKYLSELIFCTTRIIDELKMGRYDKLF